MHLPFYGSAAARLRIATALAALFLLLTGCATPVPAPAAPPAAPPPAPAGNAATAGGSGGGGCSADEYRNVDGVCVPRPTQAAAPPAGATAECRDGTYSFSQHRSGTCSHHGGVKRWL